MNKKKPPYNDRLKQAAKGLSKNNTLGEILLWNKLKGKVMNGFDFHRQKPLGNYVVDFFCGELMLAIEIDGRSHDSKFEKDEARQNEIEKLGVKFLRFTEKEVLQNMDGVIRSIEGWIEEHNGE